MDPTPKPPPMVTLATTESLTRRDSAGRYGRWIVFGVGALLLAAGLLPFPGETDYFGRWDSQLDDVFGQRSWHLTVLPPVVGLLAMGFAFLPRIARGTVLLLIGLGVYFSLLIFLLSRPDMSNSIDILKIFPLIARGPMVLLLVGGFAAASRRHAGCAGRWAGVGPAVGLLTCSVLTMRLLAQSSTPTWWAVSPTFMVPTPDGAPKGVKNVVAALWMSAALGSVLVAVIHACRPRRRTAWIGFALSLTAVGLVEMQGFITTLSGDTMQQGTYDFHITTMSAWRYWPWDALCHRLTMWTGVLLIIFGYSTLWPVRRAKILPTPPPCAISVGPENGNTTTTR